MTLLNLGLKSSLAACFQGNVSSCDGIVGYGRNDNRLTYERRRIRWFAILIASIFIRDYVLQYTNFLSLSDKASMIVSPVSPVIPVDTLRKKGEIKTVSVHTRLPSSLGSSLTS